MHFGGRHILALLGLVLAALALRATENYTSHYQTLPALDWLEAHPPLVEARGIPRAADLGRAVLRSLPLLVLREDARPLAPIFGPPAVVQRTVGGVRDAARVELGAPGGFDEDEAPIAARLDVIVFHRSVRATAWSELMAREMDARDPDSGLPQVRVTGPDAVDGVWLVAPERGGGVATVAGARGPVAFALRMTYQRPQASRREDLVDLSARAEAAARQAAADWTAWLEQRLAASGESR